MKFRPRGKPEQVDGVVLAPGAALLNQHREGEWQGEHLTVSLLPWRRNGGPLQDHPLWIRMPTDDALDEWAGQLGPGTLASFWVEKGTTGDPDGARMTAYLGPNTDAGFARAVSEWNRRRRLIDPVLGGFSHDPTLDRHTATAGWRNARVKLILEVAERGGAGATLEIAREFLETAEIWHQRIGDRMVADLPAQDPAAAGLAAPALFEHLTPRAILVRDRDEIELQYDDDGIFGGRTVIAIADAEAGQVRQVLIEG